MNHSFDASSETDVRPNSKQSKLLETLIDNIIESLQDKSCKPKVRDALLAIKLQQQVNKTSEAEKTFWDMIDDIRTSEMSEPVSLEAQILRTISSLEQEVKNGVLPVKTITDAFNKDRYEQTCLTSQRMSGLLSKMGFTMVRAANGARAIIWDDHRIFAPPDKIPCICPSGEKKHKESGNDSTTPLCVSPLIGGERKVSPPDKGDLGGYDRNAAPDEESKDLRFTIPGPSVCPSDPKSLALSPSDVEDQQDRKSGGKRILPRGSLRTGHGNLKADSKTPLCVSPLIRGERKVSPPDEEKTHQEGLIQTGKGNKKSDSKTPLCISPLIGGERKKKSTEKRGSGRSRFAPASPPWSGFG
jgi:hypothetical protein